MNGFKNWRRAISAVACGLTWAATAAAQQPGVPYQPGAAAPPGNYAPPGAAAQPGSAMGGARGVEHTARGDVPGVPPTGPTLQTAISWAEASLAQCQNIRDYAFTFVKRENVNGKINDQHEAIFMKIRRQPFSVYVQTLGPVAPKGQEAIYIQGRNEGKVQVHVTGFRHKLVGMLLLPPDAPEMMEGNRYPITTAGFDNMLVKVVNCYRTEAQGGESDVQVIPGVKIDNRPCTCVQVSHRAPAQNFANQTTRIYYDDENRMPIRWESYGWPTQAGQAPPLTEEYNYRNLQLNPGLTDADFDVNNPQYGFK